MRFCRIRFRQIIVHPVAVQIPAALAHVIGTDLHIILGRIYITEIAESLRFQILESLIVILIWTPVTDITAEGEEDNIGASDER